MGVPKFYRWLSERYPKINQVITNEALLPEFDHLYLDMNGIIHGCTHPNHLDVSDVLTERDMVLGIMHYLDRIITQIVKPKVSVYMAIDGVAPRAKLNQQRSRRFRSAKDLAEATKGKKIVPVDGADVGVVDPYAGAFDSNCITPGTEFLLRISECIRYFIRKKIKEDPLWRKLSVIFSGPEVPGEGEHKIMQHIRDMRNQPGYQPNTRHCMYGQDADLIMLGLVSHEPHFTLLREIIDFSGGFSRNDNALKEVKKFTKQSDFQLLHLSILREYLQLEFAYEHDANTYNLERLIDDFVFMTFLVGNDFLPHMPSLDIGDGAFMLLFETYKEQRAEWGQGHYLTNAGEISDAARLESFLEVIGAAEAEIFAEREKNEVVQLKKQRIWDKRDGKSNRTPSDMELHAEEESKQSEYMTMVQAMLADVSLKGEKVVDGWTPDFSQKDHKGRYYWEKLHLKPTDVDGHLELRKSYIEGLIWCLAYYYRGCISWGWFFPFHYGPMISDLTNLPEVFSTIKFELGQPLKPFEQLMGCLPPASSSLVPRIYRKLMCGADSPIKKFYPEDFVVDMNGKRNPWEGVNILPFIDVKLLKQTIEKHCPDSFLTADERHRNRIGEVFCYTYDAAANDTVPSCNLDIGLPNIVRCNSRVYVIKNHSTSTVSFKPELIPGTKIPYPGFPSLNVLPMERVDLRNAGINCFGFASKYPNMILTMHSLPQLPGALQLAGNLIGKTIFVNWPMMHEAKVVAVSDSSCEVRMVKKELKEHKFSPPEIQRWNAVSAMMADSYLVGAGYPGSGGVSIGDVQIRLKVVSLQGMKSSPVDGSSKKLFGKEEADIPIQMALSTSPAPDPRFIERGSLSLKERFPVKSRVVLTKGKYRGCIGTVLGTDNSDKVGVKVQVIPPEPPFGLAIARGVQESYISSTDAAKVLRMDPRIFGRVTGNLFFSPGKYDLGLNLKYKDKRYVLGYTRVKKNPSDQRNKKKDANAWLAGDTVLVVGSKRMSNSDMSDSSGDEKVFWEYTPKAVRLVAAYKNAFPNLFAAISKAPDERFYDAKRVFGPKGDEICAKVLEWLKSVETAAMPRLPQTTDAMPVAAVHAVQRAADVRSSTLEKDNAVKESNVKVPPAALYREASTAATDVLLASEHSVSAPPELGDRVANLCASGVPFGARGTVVAIHDPAEGCVEVVMDEEFIGGSTLQGTCANFRGKLCVWNHLLKISAADSKGIVDNMLPAGAGKAVVHQLMQDIQETEPVQDTSYGDVAAEVANKDKTPAPTPQKQSTAAAPERDPTNPWGTPSRSNSAPRGGAKRGAWREALGPPEKVVGFTKYRKAKNGFGEWKKLVAQNGRDTSCKPRTPLSDVEYKTRKSNSAGLLKAMLGVKSEPDPLPQKTENNPSGVSAGLKALLGVTSTNDHLKDNEAPPPKASAADAFMQMMMKDIPMPPPPQVIPAQQTSRSAFNFSYVKEGEEQPEEKKEAHPPSPLVNPMAVMPGYFLPPGPPVHMMPPHMIPPNMLPPHMIPPHMLPPHMAPPMYGMIVNQPMTGPPPPVAGPGTPQDRVFRPSYLKANKATTAPSAKKAAPMVPSVVVKAKK